MIKLNVLTEDEKLLLIRLKESDTFKVLKKIVEENGKIYAKLALRADSMEQVGEYRGAVESLEALIDLLEILAKKGVFENAKSDGKSS